MRISDWSSDVCSSDLNRCEDTNTQMSVRSKCRGASTARAKLQVMQHAGRRMEKVPARPRQPDARAMPLEDRNSQLALDLRDTTADRRRFNPRRTRAPTNVSCPGPLDRKSVVQGKRGY